MSDGPSFRKHTQSRLGRHPTQTQFHQLLEGDASPTPEGNGPELQEHPVTEGSSAPGSEDRAYARSSNRVFSGKASFYSYQTGKTASGATFESKLANRSPPKLAVRDAGSRDGSCDQQIGYSCDHRPRTKCSRPRSRPVARRRAQLGDFRSRRLPGSR